MVRAMTSPQGEQIDLLAWAQELEDERERERVREVNASRVERRGYLIFATDPERAPDDPGYREVYATEAKTPGEATKKVRSIADGRRLRAYLATGSHRDELADARWVA